MPRKERNKKRKARKEMVKKVDITKPVMIPLEKIGSDEDPCFGKLNDPRHPTCQKCGDIEFCAIAMGQMNTIKRLAWEEKNPVKDVEEEKLKPEDPIEVKKQVRARIKEMIELKSKPEAIILDIHGKYAINGWTKKRITKYLDKILNK
jgi:hypothetical protein